MKLFTAVLLMATYCQISFGHGAGHSHSDSAEPTSEAQPSPEDHNGHLENYLELPDDPVYLIPQEFIDMMSPEEARENIDLSEGGRIFVDKIDGIELKLKRGQLVITIDDGPKRGATDRISQMLRDRNIKGVFFVVGNRVNNHKSIMSQLYADGHMVANHTWRHELDFPTVGHMYDSLMKSMDVIRPYMRGRCYFRAPGGVFNAWRRDNLNAHHELRKCIGPFWWNIGGGSKKYPADWKCWSSGISPQQCARGYYNELLAKGRGVILMHDINNKSADMLAHLLDMMEREGIKNKDGSGFWEFMDLDQVSAIDHLEVR